MNIKTRKQVSISLFINAMVFGMAAVVFMVLLTSEPSPEGINWFTMFTTDSNLLMGIVALIGAIFDIRCLSRNNSSKTMFPKWFYNLKLASTTAVLLTFMVVSCFLVYKVGFAVSYKGTLFFTHFLIPVFSVVNLIFFENDKKLEWYNAFFAVIPTAIYSIPYIYNVVYVKYENGGWKDFYMLYESGHWVAPLILFLVITFVLGSAILLIRNKVGKPKNKNY